MSIYRNLMFGMLVVSAALSLQSCDSVSSEKEQPQGPCFRALRAMRSACAETGGSTTPPVATRYFEASVGVADTNRVPDSVLVLSGGQVANPAKSVFDRTESKLVFSATFEQVVQVPDTVYLQAFKKSAKIATLKFLKRSYGWTVVATDRDSVPQVIDTNSGSGPAF